MNVESVESRYQQVTVGTGRLRDLLNQSDLNPSHPFALEEYLQAFLSLRPEWLEPADLRGIGTFANTILELSKSRRTDWQSALLHSNQITFLLACLSQEFIAKSSAARKLIRSLEANLGCVEVNPYLPPKTALPRRTTSSPNLAYASNTFVALPPRYASSEFMPPRAKGKYEKAQFRKVHTDILRTNFGLDLSNYQLFNRDDPEAIEIVLSELYSNIIEHATNPPDSLMPHRANFRMIRYLRVPENSSPLGESLEARTIAGEYLNHLRRSKPKKLSFVSVSIFDNGPGIARHFASCRGIDEKELSRDVFEKILLTQLSATHAPGSGLGIKNAVAAVLRMDGLLAVRCNRFWALLHAGNKEVQFIRPNGDDPPSVEGTSYRIMFPRPHD